MKKTILSFMLVSYLFAASAETGKSSVVNNDSNNNNNTAAGADSTASDTTGTAKAEAVITASATTVATEEKEKTAADDKEKNVVKEEADTVKVTINNSLAKKVWDVNDSLSFIPAYDVYCKWDTSVIHPYRFDEASMIDTVTIVFEDAGCYVHPYMGEVTSSFGYRRSRMHYGVDINLETGDTVVAAFDGKIRIAKLNKSYGNVVIIRHANGLETYYAHLSKLLVSPDQDVKAGEVIGLGGNTGHSYGSHLHFEVRYRGRPIDPNEMIDFSAKHLKADTFNITKKNFDDLGVVKKTPSKYATKVPYAKNYKPGTKPVAKTTAKTPSKTKYYTVKKGDTLYSIAKRYGTTPKNIAAKNGISTKATLSVGKKLKI